VVAVALVALAGCGDGGTDELEEPTDDVATDTEEQDDAEDAAQDDAGDSAQDDAGDSAGTTVVVRDIEFQQASVTVEAGTPVTWINEDGVAHTVTSGTPDAPTEGFDEDLPAGGEVQITLEEAGTYAYWCRIHPSMTAEVVVEAAA